MEDKKSYPTLPSNYVTLAELQQRWLKQKEKEKEKELKQKQEEEQRLQQEQSPKPRQQNPRRKELKQKQEERQRLQQEQPPKPRQQNPRRNQQREPESQQQEWRATQSRRTDVVSAARDRGLKEFEPPNRNPLESSRGANEVSCEKREGFEAKADIGDENAGRDGKKKEPKKRKKKVYRKHKADEEEKKLADQAAQSTIEGAKVVESSDVQRVDEETEIKIESNGSKSNKSTMEVEEKLGTLSMNCGSDKQNDRLRRQYGSFRGSWRNYGGRSYSNGPYGGRFRGQEVQRQRGDKKIWVKKKEDSDGNVGGIQIASGK